MILVNRGFVSRTNSFLKPIRLEIKIEMLLISIFKLITFHRMPTSHTELLNVATAVSICAFLEKQQIWFYGICHLCEPIQWWSNFWWLHGSGKKSTTFKIPTFFQLMFHLVELLRSLRHLGHWWHLMMRIVQNLWLPDFSIILPAKNDFVTNVSADFPEKQWIQFMGHFGG